MPRRLTDKEFKEVYSKVQRVTVDVVITRKDAVLLTKRAIDPGKGCWHLPGGTVYYGETIREAAVRKAKEETGLDVTIIDFPFFRDFIDSWDMDGYRHVVGFFAHCTTNGGTPKKDKDASDIKWFKELPKPILIEHIEVLSKLGYK